MPIISAGSGGAALMSSFQWNPTSVSTSSTSAVMGGIGAQGGAVAIVPKSSGIVVVTIDGDVLNSGANDQVDVQCYYGSGAAPANGAAVTGTSVGPNVVCDGATGRFPFSFSRRISGLTSGTSYWFDVAIFVNAGTGTIESLTINAAERAV